MACHGCGSDWVSGGNIERPWLNGKDCVSCPWCCKMRRCKERKRGRWDRPKGELFRPSVHKKKQRRLKRQSDHCHHCGEALSPKQIKYCNSSCFYAARDAGTQQWDRTKQNEGCYHRGGRWHNAPSKKYFASIGKIDAWLAKASGLYRAILKANAADIVEYDRSCVDCGGCLPTLHGGRKQCNTCRRSKKKKRARERRRLFGNHRRRCRSYDVPFDRTITAVAVFARDGWRCQCCGRVCLKAYRMIDGVPDRKSPTIGHIVALCRKLKGHTWDNVQCECWGCNVKKGSRSEGQHRLMV